MSTFLQLVRINFWLLPLQKMLAALCLLIWMMMFIAPAQLRLGLLYAGLFFPGLVWLLCSGVMLRALSAQRQMSLLPRFRLRMLVASAAVPALAALVCSAAYMLMPAPSPSLAQTGVVALSVVLQVVSFASLLVLGMFVSSRGAQTFLALLVLLQIPRLIAHFFPEFQTWIDTLNAGHVVAFTTSAAWLAFGVWYLRARRIRPPMPMFISRMDWGIPVRAIDGAMTREQAMECWLLGSTTVQLLRQSSLLVVFFFVLLVVISGKVAPAFFVKIFFCTLSLGIVFNGAVAFSIARRSRGLWLTGARLRPQLHAWCERLMLRAMGAFLVPFLVAAGLVWLWPAVRPAMPLPSLLAALILPAAGAACLGLLQVRPSPWLQGLVGATLLVSWLFGLVVPLFLDLDSPRWGLVGFQLLLIVLLRQLAARRWRNIDWPRLRPSE